MTAAPVALVADFGFEDDVFVSAPVDGAGLDALLRATPARVEVPVRDVWDAARPAETVALGLSRLRDLDPDRIVEQVPAWQRLRVLRSQLNATKALVGSIRALREILLERLGDPARRATTRHALGLGDDVSWTGLELARAPEDHPPALREALARIDALDAETPEGRFLQRVLEAAKIDDESGMYDAVAQGMRALIVHLVSPAAVDTPLHHAVIDTMQGEIDARLSTALNALLSSRPFAGFERAWRAAAWLSEHAPVVVLHARPGAVSPGELVEHANAVGAVDLALDGDFDLDRDAEGLLAWGRAANASGGRVWFDARWDPDIVTESGRPWARVMAHRDGAALWPCAPRPLLRLPYGERGAPVKSFAFEEDLGARGEHLRWGLAGAAAAALSRFDGPTDEALVVAPAFDGRGPLEHALSAEEVTEVAARAGVTCLRVDGSVVRWVNAPAELDRARVDAAIADLDARLSAQLREILWHPSVRRLEAAWRSLAFVVDRVDFTQNVRVALFNASRDDLDIDLEDCPEVSRSGLYKALYVHEYAVPDGQPWGLLVGDYAFGPGVADVGQLRRLAAVASAMHAPLLAAASPVMFGVDAWERLSSLDDLDALFDHADYARWRAFRDTDDARYVGLTLPRFMLRKPWGAKTSPVDAFAFEEDVVDHAHYLWGSAAMALATRAADSFARYRWCPNIVGADGGVEGVGLQPRGATSDTLAVESALFEAEVRALTAAGFIALGFDARSTQASFRAASSVQRVGAFGQSAEGRAAERSARLGAQLPYLFVAARFAQYVKVVAREHIHKTDRQALEKELTAWLDAHIADVDAPDAAVRARRPLRSGRVEVEVIDRQPGWYRMVLRVRTHFTDEGEPVELSVVGRLDRE